MTHTGSDALAAEMASIVGEAHVLLDPELRASYETDWTRRYSGRSRFVVRPGSTEEVAAVLRACEQASATVVPQGGNTGLVGGSVPRRGEIVLSLKRLDHLDAVDEEAGEVTAGAGATLARLQAHARDAGWAFGVDLASRDSATIGGMIATNAGGIRMMRYGPMRAQLLGIEAVKADGSVIRRMPGLRKDNTGYDLGGLLSGSEGTLAVVTRARLRLVPALPARAVALLAVPDVRAALSVAARIRASVPSVEAQEVFFAEGVELVCKHTGAPMPFSQAYPAYLLVECAAATDPAPSLVMALDGAGEVLDSAVATDRRLRDELWRYRERHTESISAEGVPHKLDIALPLGAYAEFEHRVRGAVAEVVPGARAILFGHIGDGNLHVNLLGLEPDDEGADDAVLMLVAGLGGSISAEHGVGVAKTPWLHLTRSPADIMTMAAIKRSFDPRGILNPGVILPIEPIRPRT
ncbi:MAG: FAD-binding oxidoreductase [Dehalococcoidia bacterium]|nr:FAD-binding oxidoreductase [Dehalococcoidia bacterium]